MLPCAPPEPASRLRWRLFPALATAALLAAAWPEAGPLGWLPSPLRWPLVAVGIAGLWRPAPLAPRRRAALLEALLLALVLGCWALIKVVGLHPSRADDGVYFYLASRVAEGALPYRDFFFAHPPVHLLVPAALFRAFGFSLPLAKLIPVFAQAAAGLLLYFAARPASRRFALFALLLQLWGYQVLMGSSDLNGGNLMSAFLAGALLLITRGRPLAAGLCAGLALGTGLYSLAGMLAIGTAAAMLGGRALARYSAGVAASCLAWLAPFALLAPRPFFDGVFAYHLAKTGAGRGSLFAASSPAELLATWASNLGGYLTGSDLLRSLYFDAPGWSAAALGAVALGLAGLRSAVRGRPSRQLRALTPRRARGLAAAGLVGWLLFTLQWAALSELYRFYAVPMFLFLSLLGAWLLDAALCSVLRWRTPVRRAAGAALLAAFCLHPLLSARLGDRLWPEERREAGARVDYRWSEPWVPAPLASAARHLFFKERRTQGELEPGWRHYVWNTSLGVSTAAQIAEHLRAHSLEGETLTGGSTLAPLIALLAGRRMAADEADTNQKRFRLGNLSERDLFERACADGLRFVLAAPGTHFTEAHLERSPTLRRWFVRDREFVEPGVRHGRAERYVLYRRVEAPAEGASVCAFVEEGSRAPERR